MNRTDIEWSRNPDGTQGYTWNPITGCLNGCPYCFARKLANGRLKSRYLANHRWTPVTVPHSVPALLDPFYPRFWPSRLEDIKRMPLPWFKFTPKGIFVCDMGELFGDWVPHEWQEEVFRVIELNSQHRFYLLTKQPQNLAKFSPFPSNCFVGVSATDVITFTNAAICLGDINAKVKFISMEPLLRWGDFPADETAITQWAKGLKLYGIGWLIIGAQTPYSPKTAPKLSWVQEIVEAADKAGTPVFLKNNLKPLFIGKEEYPWMVGWRNKSGELRQEMPKNVET